MMLADETPAGGDDTAEQAVDTVGAVEDAVADGLEASEGQLRDTLPMAIGMRPCGLEAVIRVRRFSQVHR